MSKKSSVNNRVGVVYIEYKQYTYGSQLAFLWSGRGGFVLRLFVCWFLCSVKKKKKSQTQHLPQRVSLLKMYPIKYYISMT